MSEDTKLRIERIVDASPAAVFRAWTSAAAMEHWYREHPEDVVTVVELDVRVGGRYHIEFGPRGATPYVETGTYLQVDAPHRLVMQETLATPDGIAWSATTVTVSLEDQDGKTLLVLEHENFPSVEQRDGAAGGWPGFIDRLSRLVTAG